jgi:four helix bundle protein
MNENIILEKSITFSVRMIKLSEYLREKKQRVIADQILRSGMSIGANIAESDYASSKADFINKLKISEKEAGETAYWLRVLYVAQIIDDKQYNSLFADITELQKMIGTSLKTLKGK